MGDELNCWTCGRRSAAPAVRCDCGEPLWYDTDEAPVSTARCLDSMWTTGAPLPVERPTGMPGSVGGSPLIRMPELDAECGCRVYIKDETRNPTGTFKDRGSAVGVALAKAAGARAVGTVSHGNMAISVAATATALDMDAVVLVPEDIPPARHAHIARFDPQVLRVVGNYGSLYRETLEFGPNAGITFLNSDVPTRVAGQKTVAYEVIGALDDPPDAMILPVSSGGNASAVWKAVREIRKAGIIEEIPRLYFVQAAACDPIATAFRNNEESVAPTEAADTVAYSIANPDPPSGNRALSAARETGGGVVSVDDREINDAQTTIATAAGLAVEPASATTVAGLRRLANDGTIQSEERVVAVASGTGFREEPEIPTDAETVSLSYLEPVLASAVSP